MRVYGLHSEINIGPPVQSTATYTRLPPRTAENYTAIARSSTPNATLIPREATHRVAPGDTLTRIVRDFLQAQGDSPTNSAIYDGVRKVAGANGLSNADLIHPGQDIDLSVLRTRLSASTPLAETPTPIPPVEARITSVDIPPPAARASARPADALLEKGLTRSAGPLAVPAPPVTTLAQAPEPETVAPDDKDAPTAMGGHVDDSITALQRLLNRTAGTLAMVRDLVDRDRAPADNPALVNPWEPVLKGAARLSSEYGMRKDPFTGRMAFHDGIDLAAKRGTEITALRAGEVVYSGWKSGYGNTVVVRHDNGYESLYGHTSKNLVSVGDRIDSGAIIAEVGSTGRSTGPHLHLEMRRHGKPVNPLPHLESAPLRMAQSGTGS